MLESRGLADPGFAQLGGQVVFYAHNTSHVPGEVHAKLPAELGITGYPSIVFLDAAGECVRKFRLELRRRRGW